MSTTKSLACTAVAVLLAGCVPQYRHLSVCDVRASPDTFIGINVELSGLADVHRHGTSLTDPSCPTTPVALGSPPDEHEGSAADTFFLSLAPGMLPGAPAVPVKVRGKLMQQLDRLPRYIFIVQSGAVLTTGGG